MGLAIRYLKKYRVRALCAPLFKMLEAIFELLVPLVMADMIDRGIAAGDSSRIFRSFALLILLAAAGFAVSITAQFFAASSAAYSVRDMRADLFSHIMSFSEESYDKIGAGILITRLTSDLTQVQNGINMFLRLFLRSPFIVSGALVMSALISLPAAGIVLLVISALSVTVSIISRLTLPVFKKIQSLLERLMLLVGENIEGVRVIRAFGDEDRQLSKFTEGTGELYRLQQRAGGVQAFLNPLTYAAVNLGVCLLLYYSSFSVAAGGLTQGQVVALLNYLSQILVELLKFASLIILITRGLASASRIEDVFNEEPDRRLHTGSAAEPDPDAEYAISFDDVSFAYPGGDPALLHISFDLREGETLGIVGGTGSGKTTITRLLRHTVDAQSGSIRLYGRNVADYDDDAISSIVNEVPQRVTLLKGTISENLSLGNDDITETGFNKALKIAQAEDFVIIKGGIYSDVERFGRNFSGGQRQRLSIARSLTHDSRILILDDATSALDKKTEAALLKSLDELRGLTKIIISQRATSVMNADRIMVLDDGWCVGLGTHSELMKRCDVYQEIFNA